MTAEIELDLPEYDCVYVPSQSIEPEEISKIPGFVFYEERPLLCSILRLRTYPKARCVFVTSIKVQPNIVSYYLQIAANATVSEQSIRDRLLLVSVDDGSSHALTQKVLDKPEIIREIKEWIRPEKAFMRCVISTSLEEALAGKLGIPLRANPSDLASLGTKHGSRKIFKEADIPLADGTEEVFSAKEFLESVVELWNRNPTHEKYVAKLNDGVSGDGNATFHLQPDKMSLSHDEKLKYVEEKLQNSTEFVSNNESWSSFEKKLIARGALVELWMEGSGATSPSSQGFITDDGKVLVLSTHEQILEKSLYLGCRFPASSKYHSQLCTNVSKIGKALAAHGARERFGVDFVVIPPQNDSQEQKMYAIEINLRSGGTTHPCETARLICKGTYCSEHGYIIAHDKVPKYYHASDNVMHDLYKNFTFTKLTKVIEQSESRWNKERMVGCVFYFLGALPGSGKVGMLALGNSNEEASQLFEGARKAIQDYATSHFQSSA